MPIEQAYQQATFDELLALNPLRDTTFLVVDLETTGTTSKNDSITEIGAVKVRGGEPQGEFSTLVNPGEPIPPLITSLTGITPAMVATAPTLASALPAFLEFAAGAVWVAHNAPFDIGFLRAACRRYGYAWPRPAVVDTVMLARRILPHGEVPNNKLATLARHFRASVTPTHRALDDARATVDVLHGLLARVGNLGIDTLSELVAYSSRISPEIRRKRHLADSLPERPGVYIFRSADDRPLYVGTSRNVYSRVRGYFTASEPRRRMRDMIAAAERVEAVPCAHQLEAQIRELRIIAAHKPPYNRRDKYPERALWLRLTEEPYPRLSLVRSVTDQQRFLGPFSSQTAARAAAAAIYEALPIRQCTARLSSRRASTACALAELGKCGAPCEHAESIESYNAHIETLATAIAADPEPVVTRLLDRLQTLAAAQRFEDASAARDRLTTLLRTVMRGQRVRALVGVTELIAAQPDSTKAWDIAVIRHGRLATAARAANSQQVLPLLPTLRATAETVENTGAPAAHLTETEHLLRWLDQPGTRIVTITGEWSSPTRGAGRWGPLLHQLSAVARGGPARSDYASAS